MQQKLIDFEGNEVLVYGTDFVFKYKDKYYWFQQSSFCLFFGIHDDMPNLWPSSVNQYYGTLVEDLRQSVYDLLEVDDVIIHFNNHGPSNTVSSSQLLEACSILFREFRFEDF